MADKQNVSTEAENVDVKDVPDAKDTKPKGKQIAATFSEEEIAWIREAQFAKRQLRPTELVRAAVLAYIADVPKPE